jgi:hypothetical protein
VKQWIIEELGGYAHSQGKPVPSSCRSVNNLPRACCQPVLPFYVAVTQDVFSPWRCQSNITTDSSRLDTQDIRTDLIERSHCRDLGYLTSLSYDFFCSTTTDRSTEFTFLLIHHSPSTSHTTPTSAKIDLPSHPIRVVFHMIRSDRILCNGKTRSSSAKAETELCKYRGQMCKEASDLDADAGLAPMSPLGVVSVALISSCSGACERRL